MKSPKKLMRGRTGVTGSLSESHTLSKTSYTVRPLSQSVHNTRSLNERYTDDGIMPYRHGPRQPRSTVHGLESSSGLMSREGSAEVKSGRPVRPRPSPSAPTPLTSPARLHPTVPTRRRCGRSGCGRRRRPLALHRRESVLHSTLPPSCSASPRERSPSSSAR